MKTRTILALLVGTAAVSRGADMTASSLDQATVRSEFATFAAQYVTGDSFILPAGSSTWTLGGDTGTAGLTIAGLDGVKIRGAGIGSTILTDHTATGSSFGMFNFTGYASATTPKAFEISGMTINGSLTAGQRSEVGIRVGAPQGFRIHHISFQTVYHRGIFVDAAQGNTKYPTGVIDHCDFYTSQFGIAQFVTVQGNAFDTPPTNAAGSNGSWKEAPPVGTGAAVYIEDCTMSMDQTNDSAVETYVGGRCIIRYCPLLRNFLTGAHGHDSSARGGHWLEVYHCTITQTIGNALNTILNLRAGSGTFHDNDISWSGTGFASTDDVTLQHYRGVGTKLSGLNTTTATTAYNTTSSETTRYIYSTGSKRYVKADDSTKYIQWTIDHWEIFGDGAVQYTKTGQTFPELPYGFYAAAGTQTIGDANGCTILNQYTDSFANGAAGADGNQTVANGIGTHTGSTGATTLTDSTQSWATNVMLGDGTAAHDDELWTYVIWNRTSGAAGFITANTATTVTAALSGGTRQTWTSGDTYIITKGYPALDMPGWTGPTTFYDRTGTATTTLANMVYSTQTRTPVYAWNNTFNGSADTRPVGVSWAGTYDSSVSPRVTDFIQSGREYVLNAGAPSGYTEYTYPHPLVSGGTSPTAPNTLAAPASTSSSIDLTWVDASTDETGFEIERSLNGSTGWTLVVTTAAGAQSYTDGGLASSTTYYYRVRAVNGSGNSSYTSNASATTQAAASSPVRARLRRATIWN